MNKRDTLLALLAAWRWYHTAALVLPADVALSYVLWKFDAFGDPWLVVSLLNLVGLSLFLEVRAGIYNDNAQCARCGCSIVDKEIVIFGEGNYRLGSCSVTYCQRCGKIARLEQGLLVGGIVLGLLLVISGVTEKRTELDGLFSGWHFALLISPIFLFFILIASFFVHGFCFLDIKNTRRIRIGALALGILSIPYLIGGVGFCIERLVPLIHETTSVTGKTYRTWHSWKSGDGHEYIVYVASNNLIEYVEQEGRLYESVQKGDELIVAARPWSKEWISATVHRTGEKIELAPTSTQISYMILGWVVGLFFFAWPVIYGPIRNILLNKPETKRPLGSLEKDRGSASLPSGVHDRTKVASIYCPKCRGDIQSHEHLTHCPYCGSDQLEAESSEKPPHCRACGSYLKALSSSDSHFAGHIHFCGHCGFKLTI